MVLTTILKAGATHHLVLVNNQTNIPDAAIALNGNINQDHIFDACALSQIWKCEHFYEIKPFFLGHVSQRYKRKNCPKNSSIEHIKKHNTTYT